MADVKKYVLQRRILYSTARPLSNTINTVARCNPIIPMLQYAHFRSVSNIAIGGRGGKGNERDVATGFHKQGHRAPTSVYVMYVVSSMVRSQPYVAGTKSI